MQMPEAFCCGNFWGRNRSIGENFLLHFCYKYLWMCELINASMHIDSVWAATLIRIQEYAFMLHRYKCKNSFCSVFGIICSLRSKPQGEVKPRVRLHVERRSPMLVELISSAKIVFRWKTSMFHWMWLGEYFSKITNCLFHLNTIFDFSTVVSVIHDWNDRKFVSIEKSKKLIVSNKISTFRNSILYFQFHLNTQC